MERETNIGEPERPHREPERRGPSREQLRYLVERATLAPSGGNCQPWKFVVTSDGCLRCYRDRVRAENFLDFDYQATHAALGAAVENIVVTAAALGYATDVAPFPSTTDPDLAATLTFLPQGWRESDAELAPLVEQRATNRRPGKPHPIAPDVLGRMSVEAEARNARLQFVTDRRQLKEVAAVVGGCDLVRLYSEQMHREMMAEMRWTKEEAESTGDGVDLRTVELSGAEEKVLKLLASWRVVKALRALRFGRALEMMSRRAVDCSGAVGLITVDGTDDSAYFQGGRAMERVWLQATAEQLALQPLAVPPYLFARYLRGDGLSDRQRKKLRGLRERLMGCFHLVPERGEIMLFRLTHADAPSVRALRLPVDDVLSFEADPHTD